MSRPMEGGTGASDLSTREEGTPPPLIGLQSPAISRFQGGQVDKLTKSTVRMYPEQSGV